MPLRAPDVEGAVVAVLAAAGMSARDVLAAPWPALRVTRVGGDRARVADTALVQIDAAVDAGGSKVLCLSHLERAISALRDVEGKTRADVVFAAVQISGGPVYLPDPVTGAPRYTATLAVTSRALVRQSP